MQKLSGNLNKSERYTIQCKLSEQASLKEYIAIDNTNQQVRFEKENKY